MANDKMLMIICQHLSTGLQLRRY